MFGIIGVIAYYVYKKSKREEYNNDYNLI